MREYRTPLLLMEPIHLKAMVSLFFVIFFAKGAATGIVAFTTEDVERLHKEGVKSILVRAETSPEDVGGMYAAAGILTARGGKLISMLLLLFFLCRRDTGLNSVHTI